MSRRHEEFEEFARARTPHLYRSAWLLCGDTHRASAQRRRSTHERPTEHLPERPGPDDGTATPLALAAALDRLRAVLGTAVDDLIES